jgi:hypothetical protein
MRWIKITHTGGDDYLNIEQVYRVVQTSPTEITFYDANSILPASYTFASASQTSDFLSKFEKIFQVVFIDQLAPQG